MAESDWSQWEKYVIEELKRHQDDHREIQRQLTQITVDIAALKIKAGVWGLIGSAIPVVGVVLYEILTKR